MRYELKGECTTKTCQHVHEHLPFPIQQTLLTGYNQ